MFSRVVKETSGMKLVNWIMLNKYLVPTVGVRVYTMHLQFYKVLMLHYTMDDYT